jgi:hypothetical protein
MRRLPSAFLGPNPFAPPPIAILTKRGTVRTRKRVKLGRQAYPPDGPSAWLQRGRVTCTVQCLAPYCTRRADVAFATLGNLP